MKVVVVATARLRGGGVGRSGARAAVRPGIRRRLPRRLRRIARRSVTDESRRDDSRDQHPDNYQNTTPDHCGRCPDDGRRGTVRRIGQPRSTCYNHDKHALQPTPKVVGCGLLQDRRPESGRHHIRAAADCQEAERGP